MTAVATITMTKPYALQQDSSQTHAHREAGEDLALLTRCMDGDRTAFREIYHGHRARVFSVVSRMVSNDADREEITQEAFLQIFRSIPNFKGTSKLSTWIHRISMNVALQHIRRKQSRIKLHMDGDLSDRSLAQSGVETHVSPEEDTMSRQRQAAVERSLHGLSPKKRAVLVLHDFEGIKAGEISEIVNAPVLTVRTRLFYARREFYKLLAGEPACADLDLGEEARG